mmetsp:Transcript_14374/g.34051  ORF Transcript_14374/g.34051 Transcript_14374/m.34051 type:complete len:222 (+) Transcript_14374:623-1288(+)
MASHGGRLPCCCGPQSPVSGLSWRTAAVPSALQDERPGALDRCYVGGGSVQERPVHDLDLPRDASPVPVLAAGVRLPEPLSGGELQGAPLALPEREHPAREVLEIRGRDERLRGPQADRLREVHIADGHAIAPAREPRRLVDHEHVAVRVEDSVLGPERRRLHRVAAPGRRDSGGAPRAGGLLPAGTAGVRLHGRRGDKQPLACCQLGVLLCPGHSDAIGG